MYASASQWATECQQKNSLQLQTKHSTAELRAWQWTFDQKRAILASVEQEADGAHRNDMNALVDSVPPDERGALAPSLRKVLIIPASVLSRRQSP